jgi:hypothetical protein
MSHDLHVIAKRRAKASDLDAFGTEHPGLEMDGRLKTDGFVTFADASGTHVELDGPSRIEAEDVPDAALGAIGRSGWLIQLSVKPAAGADGWPTELAVHLARAADGVVHDPQLDRVTWPPGFEPRDAATGEERFSEISLAWYTAWPSQDAELPRRLLDLLASRLPDALPKRYGGYEPLPHRHEGNDREEQFIGHWLEEASGWTPSLSWTTTPPCLGGSAWMSTTQPVTFPRPGQPMVRVSVEFDSRASARDPALTERLVAAFRTIAVGLRCVYAGATLNRDAIMKRGRPLADSRTEWGPMPRADRWTGLPAAPTWLAWFGRPYANLVRPTLAGVATEEDVSGILLRLGTEPMHADDLADRFPPLPAELITHRLNRPAAWETNIRYTLVAGPPSQPAAVTPTLDHGQQP